MSYTHYHAKSENNVFSRLHMLQIHFRLWQCKKILKSVKICQLLSDIHIHVFMGYRVFTFTFLVSFFVTLWLSCDVCLPATLRKTVLWNRFSIEDGQRFWEHAVKFIRWKHSAMGAGRAMLRLSLFVDFVLEITATCQLNKESIDIFYRAAFGCEQL